MRSNSRPTNEKFFDKMNEALEPILTVWNEEYSKVGETQEIPTCEDDDVVMKFIIDEIQMADENLLIVAETMR